MEADAQGAGESDIDLYGRRLGKARRRRLPRAHVFSGAAIGKRALHADATGESLAIFGSLTRASFLL